jgi:hypothetical protein
MPGYDRSPDYGGPEPRPWRIAIAFVGLIAAAVLIYYVIA